MRNKLQEIRELLSNPNRWTKGALARDPEGERLYSAHMDHATCFCLIGATHRVALDPHIRHQLRQQLQQAVTQRFQCHIYNVEEFNDSEDTTHEMVIAVIDHAIAL